MIVYDQNDRENSDLYQDRHYLTRPSFHKVAFKTGCSLSIKGFNRGKVPRKSLRDLNVRVLPIISANLESQDGASLTGIINENCLLRLILIKGFYNKAEKTG